MVLTNQQLAQRLRERAQRLAQEGANVYRVRALRRAALVILGLPCEAAQMLTPQGRKMLMRIPGIGRGIARTIAEWVHLSQEAEAGTAPTTVDPDGVVPLSGTLSSTTGYPPVCKQSRPVPGQTGDKDKDTRQVIHNRKGSETWPLRCRVVDDDVPSGSQELTRCCQPNSKLARFSETGVVDSGRVIASSTDTTWESLSL